MIDKLKFEQFYDSILTSLDEKKVPLIKENLVQFEESPAGPPDSDFTDARIMVTSWVDFFDNLLKMQSADSLLGNLNNHLNFIKKIPSHLQNYHLNYFRTISEKLFNFLLIEEYTLTTSLEIEDDFKTFEFDLYALKKEENMEDVLLSILSKDFTEINETTESHIRGLIENLKKENEEKILFHAIQLKAIQETILTVLQMDREKQQDAVERTLKKEFELINACFYFLKKLIEGAIYKSLNGNLAEFKISYDYPFIDILKTISKWYQNQEPILIKEAFDILNYIKAKKPFRLDDRNFTENLELLLIISTDFIEFQNSELDSAFLQLIGTLQSPPDHPLNQVIWDFTEKVNRYFIELENKIGQCLEFFYDQLIPPGITLLYKRKIFYYIAQICQVWIKKDFISEEKSKIVLSDLMYIKTRLQQQSLKKLGDFREISFKLTDHQLLAEFEKGMGTHLLFGLEDFLEWVEGKEIRENLLSSPLKKEARFQIIENLYKIAIEITENSDNEDAAIELQEIQKEMIRTFGTKIIEENLPRLPKLLMLFYSSLIIHTINLANDEGKLTDEERHQLLEKLEKKLEDRSKTARSPLFKYANSRIFSEEYEKEFSSLISIFHLYIPIINL
jgi:hypothetical protein